MPVVTKVPSRPKAGGFRALVFVATLGATVVGGGVPATAQATPSVAARAAIQKLTANNAFPYTQLSLRVARLSGAGVPPRYVTLATGLELVVASQQGGKQDPMGSEALSVYYKGTALGQFRVVKGNAYVLLDVAHWTALPLRWGASAQKTLSSLDLAVGERWFELPGPLLKQMEAQGSASLSVPSVIKRAGSSPAALRNLVVSAMTKLVGGLDLKEAPSGGGNLTFSANGSLKSLAGDALSIGRALHMTGAPGPTALAKVPQGTYSLVMSTADAGRYVANVNFALQVAGKGSVDLTVALAHAVEPVVAPQGAKVVTPQMLSGLGI